MAHLGSGQAEAEAEAEAESPQQAEALLSRAVEVDLPRGRQRHT